MTGENVVRLVFRAERNKDAEVTAVYDEPLSDSSRVAILTVYAHMGQHGSGSLDWYRRTRAAKPEEYAPLLKEMQSIVKLSDPTATVVVGKRLAHLYD